MSSSGIHCCYIILTKECPFLLLESPRPLSPPWGPQTSYQPASDLTLPGGGGPRRSRAPGLGGSGAGTRRGRARP